MAMWIMKQTISLNHIKQRMGKVLCEELQNSLFLQSQNQEPKRRKRESQKLIHYSHMGRSKRTILMKFLQMNMEIKQNRLLKVPKDKNIRILQMTIMGRILLMITHLTQQIKTYSLKDKMVNILMNKRKIESKKMSIIIMFRDNLKSLLKIIQWMKFHLKKSK